MEYTTETIILEGNKDNLPRMIKELEDKGFFAMYNLNPVLVGEELIHSAVMLKTITK